MDGKRSWKSMRRRTVMVAAGITALATVAAACGGDAQDAGPATKDGGAGSTAKYLNPVVNDDRPKLGGKLVYGINADTNSWNPAAAQWGSYSMLKARTMFEFLTEFDKDGVIKPYLAESMVPNADFTEWTFTLRPGIKWAGGWDGGPAVDGTPMTAQQVTETLRFIRDSQVVGEGIRLAKDFTAVDDRTFKVSMEKPWATFPQGMVSQLGAIPHPDWLKSDKHFQPVGSGPFQIDKWMQGTSLAVKRNPHYWRKDQWGNTYPYFDGVEFRIIPDERERANALRSGEIDIMLQTLASPDVAELRKEAQDGLFQSFSDDEFETAEDHIVLNTKKAPFDDPDARRALAYATDQQAYIAEVTGNLNTAADSSLATNSPWYSATDYPTYDLAKAKELVEKVKAKPGNEGKFEFDLTTQQTPEAAKIQQYLTDMWAKAGITAKPNQVKNEAKIIGMVTGSHEATIVQLYDAPFPLNDGVFWPGTDDAVPGYSLSFARLVSPKLVSLYEEAVGSPDPAVQKRAQADIQKEIGREVPYIWLAHVSRTVVASNNLVNVVHHTLPDGSVGLDFMQGSHALYQVWRKS